MRNLGLILGAAAGGWVALAGGCELIAGVEDAVPYPKDAGTGGGGHGGGGGQESTATTSTGSGGAGGCDNGILDGNETGKDCGGPCTPCVDGAGCKVGPDCTSKVCLGGTCIPPKCTDQVKNGAETSADCGGTECPKCLEGKACSVGDDCQIGICKSNLCALPPSCSGLAAKCGAGANEICCITSRVTGGTYNRSNDAAFPATVSDFRLDRFEVTVGRFRKFVEAYPGSKPIPGAGQHPSIADSGWDPLLDKSLPADLMDFETNLKGCAALSTWTDAIGTNEDKPINCVSWPEAFAFCAWDGGRLATEAEWNYAAAGGNQQLQYPWGANIDATYAVYDCAGDGSPPGPGNCLPSDILNVGSTSSKGDGRWGQADLAGNVWEWTLDSYGNSYPSPCIDCARVGYSLDKMTRGGGWSYSASSLFTSLRASFKSLAHLNEVGLRCARNP